MATGSFGYEGTGNAWVIIEDIHARATAFPFDTGAPTDSYENGQFGTPPPWPGDIGGEIANDSDGDHCYLTECEYDGDTLKPTKVRAYLKCVQASGGTVAAAVYTEAGALIASSEAQGFTTSEQWVEFDVTGDLALVEGTNYCLWVVGNYDAINELVELRQAEIADWEEPVPGPAPSNGGGGAVGSAPLLTGGGMF